MELIYRSRNYLLLSDPYLLHLHREYLPKQKLSVTIRPVDTGQRQRIYRSRNYLLLSDNRRAARRNISTEVEIICYYQTYDNRLDIFMIYRSRNYLLLSDTRFHPIKFWYLPKQKLSVTIRQYLPPPVSDDLPKQKLSVTIRRQRRNVCASYLPKQKLSVTIRHGNCCTGNQIYRSRNYLLLSDLTDVPVKWIPSTEVEIICYYQTCRRKPGHKNLPKQKLSVTIRPEGSPLLTLPSTEVEIICYYQTGAGDDIFSVSTEVEIICYYQTDSPIAHDI